MISSIIASASFAIITAPRPRAKESASPTYSSTDPERRAQERAHPRQRLEQPPGHRVHERIVEIAAAPAGDRRRSVGIAAVWPG